MGEIILADVAQAQEAMADLVALLQDAVADGASVGFLPPVSDADARAYWQGTLDDLARGQRALLLAVAGGHVVGSVQLDPAGRANGAHRAEVQKLMVHRAARRQGLARALMAALERHARGIGRTLLILDTREGDTAETFYARCGYTRAGVIPRYARNARGTLDGTVFFYKELDAGA